jgi:hypothetical protein
MRPNAAGSDPWVQQAHSVPIEDELARRGIHLRGKIERAGPCPVCGGTDRFSINTEKQLWNCRGCGKGGDVIDLVQHIDGSDFTAACTMLAGERPQAKPNGNGKDHAAAEPEKIAIAKFRYDDEAGNLLFAVTRAEYQNADGSFVTKDGKRKKTFHQRRPDPDRPGKWVWNVDGVPIVPYRLPELIEAVGNGHFVVIVEGEAKVDLLRSWNVPATCNAGGAGKWKPEHSAFLQGADVVILPDNDQPGRKHRDVVGASLQGIAASIRVLDLPNLPPKADVKDWATAGGTVEQFHDLIERKAKPWAPHSATSEAGPKAKQQEENAPAVLTSARASSFEMTGIEWLWPDRFAIGKVGLIAGLPDEGKGQVLSDMAARITCGEKWPCDEGAAPRGNVLLLTAEDDISDTVAPRLAAAGANLETLAEIQDGGVKIVGHTEAILANSYWRLRSLGIERFFNRLYTLEGRDAIHILMDSRWTDPPEGFVTVVPREERKPNPRLLADICRKEGADIRSVYYVGDSLVRDVAMAKQAGVTAIWARYGTKYDPDSWQYLVKVTHWTDDDVEREKALKAKYGEVVPDYTIDSFSQLKSIVLPERGPTTKFGVSICSCS